MATEKDWCMVGKLYGALHILVGDSLGLTVETHDDKPNQVVVFHWKLETVNIRRFFPLDTIGQYITDARYMAFLLVQSSDKEVFSAWPVETPTFPLVLVTVEEAAPDGRLIGVEHHVMDARRKRLAGFKDKGLAVAYKQRLEQLLLDN